MKVSGPGSVGSTGAAGQARKASGGFSLPGADQASPARGAARTGSVSAVGALEALLALQQVDTPLERRRRAVRRAGRILDVLDEVKLGVLDGGVETGSLHRLQSAVRQEQGEADDPGLAGVLREIEARAAVELAKLEMSRQAA